MNEQSPSKQASILSQIARKANASVCIEEVTQLAIDSIREYLDWQIGHVYIPDQTDSQKFKSANIWSLATGYSCPEFVSDSQNTEVMKGDGVIGLAVSKKDVLWLEDVMHEARLPKVKDYGLRAALIVPVIVDGSTKAILEFYGSNPQKIDESSLALACQCESILSAMISRIEVQQDMIALTKELEEKVEQRTAELKKANDFVSNIFETANVMIVGLDHDGNLSLFNDTTCQITGYSREELEDGNWFELIVPKDKYPEVWGIFAENALKGLTPKEFENPILTKEGKERHISWRNAAFKEGEIATLSFGLDVTHIKEVEKAMLQAKRVAEEANKAKSRFLKSMSHEIRTPLNSILGYAQILELECTKDSVLLDYTKNINRSGNNLLHLINSILEMSVIEAGEMTIENVAFSPTELITDIDVTLRPSAIKKGLSLDVKIDEEFPKFILQDAGKVRQILMNLVSNAINYTDEGSVSVQFSAPSDILRVTVSDTGTGIKEEDRVRIFEEFERLDAALSNKKGSGLGLAISRQFARLLGGEITVESQFGVGSVFSLELPFTDASHGAAEAINRENTGKIHLKNGSSILALVADDIESSRLVLYRLLEKEGVKVIEASNGQEAFDLTKSEKPDIVFMDVAMPIVDGNRATAMIKADPEISSTIVLTVSASVFKDEVETALQSGSDGFISKPVNADMLLEKMNQLLDK